VQPPRAWYEQGRQAHALALAGLEARARSLAGARLLVAGAACALLGGIVWAHLGPAAWLGMAGLALGFVALVIVHARVHDQAERARAGVRFHDRGLARLGHVWDALPTSSERFKDPDHPFAGDLDVFGRASLMQLVDATETRFGEERLARLLSAEVPIDWPRGLLGRQRAARDLAPRLAFREGFAIAGSVVSREKLDPAGLIAWAERRDQSPALLEHLLPIAAWLQPVLVVALMALGPSMGLSSGMSTLVFIGALTLGILAGARMGSILEAVSANEWSVTQWRTMLAAVEREPFEADLLRARQEALGPEGARASQEVGRLERIVGYANARRNEVFRFLIGPLLMWDVHCALALQRWRNRTGMRLRTWMDTLAEVEALASLAAFAFDRPDFVWPEPETTSLFDGRAIGHPLILSDRRVDNDVRLAGTEVGTALVVTGSNMSGKSTLLRAIGANAVLAYAGAPVCARALRLGPTRVATSMRVSDSLEQGVSHFYAELRRLKRVIDIARAAHESAGPPAMFLLDEILHGTNSRERVLGACAVVRDLVQLGAIGAVSTHDLGITALERELPDRVTNAHLEEQVQGDVMTFDYVLRPGIVQSSNALRLMRAVGIEVGEVNECP
jgi:MutS domain V